MEILKISWNQAYLLSHFDLKSFKSWIACDYFCAIYALIQFVKSSSVLCRVNKNSYFEKKYKFLFVQVKADLQTKEFRLKFIRYGERVVLGLLFRLNFKPNP